jgi:hypothetical protein
MITKSCWCQTLVATVSCPRHQMSPSLPVEDAHATPDLSVNPLDSSLSLVAIGPLATKTHQTDVLEEESTVPTVACDAVITVTAPDAYVSQFSVGPCMTGQFCSAPMHGLRK